MINNRPIDQFIQNWYNSVFDLSKCFNFRIFKQNPGFKNYLTVCLQIKEFLSISLDVKITNRQLKKADL